jgi:hypothetical protein
MEAWDRSCLFETIITRIDKCVAYAAYAGEPYMLGQILSKTFHIVFQIGEWKQQPAAAKTYVLFKKHILLAQQDNRNEEHTTKQTRYGLAAQKLEEMTENFANYVAVEQVTQASTLAAAHEEKLMSDAANQQALQDLTNQYAQRKQLEAMAKWHSLATNRLQGALQHIMAQIPHTRRPTVDQGSYCWSHGFHVAPVHTSTPCRTPRPGHQTMAMRQNTMGGNLQGKLTA